MAKSERRSDRSILLRGATENNLKGVTVSVPVGLLTCLTGVSGSGKSTLVDDCLVDDCLVAEAARRHQVLSRSTRRVPTPYSPRLEEARLPYVVCVRQGILQWNSRSTVATATGLLQRLRDVMARHPEVRSGGKPLGPLRAETVADWCLTHHGGSTTRVSAAIERRVLGPISPHIERAIRRLGDLPVTMSVVETGHSPQAVGDPPEKFRRMVTKTHRDVYAILGEPVPAGRAGEFRARVQLGMDVAKTPDDIVLAFPDEGDESCVLLAGCLLDPSDPRVFWVPSHSLLSFNSQLPRSGRCPTCEGTGAVEEISEAGLIADPAVPLAGGGLRIPYEAATARYKYFPPLAEEIRGLLTAHSLSVNAAWKDLGDLARAEILQGSGDRVIQPRSPDGGPKGKRKPFTGLIDRIRSKLAGDSSGAAALAALRRSGPCPDCGGTRLNHAARSVFFGGRSFPDILNQTLAETGDWLAATAGVLSDTLSSGTLAALAALCGAGNQLGLGHLALNRPVGTLSGGEGQRLRIAGALAARLQGACYALDEPTRGLHAADAAQLCDTLRDLADGDTTVLLVEHNPAVVAGADWVVEMGPGGGPEGGEVVYDGPPGSSPLLNTPETKRTRPAFAPAGELVLKGIVCRNIRDQELTFPLGGVVCVTGVSGSGKSTLVRDVLAPALEAWIESGATTGNNFRKLTVRGRIDRLVYVSQNALSTNPRSLVLSFLGLADVFRDWFHRNSDATDLGLSAGHFSPNTELGQCPACEGLGRVGQAGEGAAVCPACAGTRFHPHVLFARCRERGVGDWLALDLHTHAESEEAPEFLRGAARLASELGLGHLSPGRALPTLSGGECQRLRIVKALLEAQAPAKGDRPHQLFVMDEPAAGLHPADVDRLNTALHRVVAKGENTLVLVEHNLSVIRLADWVVDVGPSSAEQGGQVMFAGSVESFLRSGPPESRTRQALRGKLQIPKTRQTRSHPVNNPDRPHGAAEAIGAFRDFLAQAVGERDADETAIPTRPAYLISAGGEDTHDAHDVLGLLSLSLPLFRVFAAESAVIGQTVYSDDGAARAAAVAALTMIPGRRAAWFPATTVAAQSVVTWEDIRAAIKRGLTAGTREWFDGASVQRKAPPTSPPSEGTRHVRLLLPLELPAEEAVRRAFALGEGWLSVIDPVSAQVFDFTTRAISNTDLRVGARWMMPQLFDPGIAQMACTLCKGGGNVEAVEEKLVIADRNAGIRQDRLFTKHAMEALRAARRRQMLPAIDRLAEAGLVELDAPPGGMSSDVLTAFWFGYPDKSFLSSGGNENHKGDWYQWLGLANYVVEHMWKSPDRSWANELNASRHKRQCPRCGGTGLGWEARLREVGGITLQTVLTEWTVKRLSGWLNRLEAFTGNGRSALLDARARADSAVRLGLGELRCGARYPSLSPGDRFRTFAVAAARHQLLGATAYVRPPTETAGDTARLIAALREDGNMEWVVETTDAGIRASSA